MTTQKIVTIGVGVALAGFALWSIYRGPLWVRDGDEHTLATTTPAVVATTSNDNREAKIVGSPDVNIEYGYASEATGTPQKTLKLAADSPSLNRAIIIPASFSPADASLIKESIAKLITAIKKRPDNGALWAELGLKRKGIEDYEGAKEAYEYALKLMPNNAMVADSLGVIYGDYLKDYTKAVRYFRLAIDIDPSANYRYMRLFELYQYALKDNGKAKAILEEGLRAIPNEPSLQALLETVK